MEKTLSQTWNGWVALSEFTSSALLVLLVFMTSKLVDTYMKQNHFAKSLTKSAFWGVSGLLAIIIGMEIANIASPGDGLALMTLPFAIIKCIEVWKFNALPVIIVFQLLGGIIGGLIAIWFEKILTYTVKESKLGDNLFVNNDSYKFLTYKSTLFQFLIIILLMFVSTFTFTGTTDNLSFYFGLICLSLGISFLFMLSSRSGWFMLSPWISVAGMINAAIFKKFKIRHLYNFGIELSIQQAYAITIAMIFHFVAVA